MDDTLFGGEGDDTLNGGNGADNFSCGSGTDTITDFSTTQGDIKRITAKFTKLQLIPVSVSLYTKDILVIFSIPY
jgi:Ca2+-binding RTX toxin-like protein